MTLKEKLSIFVNDDEEVVSKDNVIVYDRDLITTVVE